MRRFDVTQTPVGNCLIMLVRRNLKGVNNNNDNKTLANLLSLNLLRKNISKRWCENSQMSQIIILKELEVLKEGPNAKILLYSIQAALKIYQIGKHQVTMAYMDTGFKQFTSIHEGLAIKIN